MHPARRREGGHGRRFIPLAVMLACTVLLPPPARVAAQANASVSLEIVVDVVNGLSVFHERALNFGDVLAGSGTRSVTATDPNAGLFRIYGRRNRWVDVVLTPPSQLVNGSHQIPYAWQASKNETANDAAAGVPVPGLTDRLRLRDFSAAGSDGMAWIWIFGSIDLGGGGSTLAAGTYTGVFTISVAY